MVFLWGTRYTSAVIEDTIVDGVTDKAASQNAIFDALALKATKTSSIEAVDAGLVSTENVSAVVTSDATTAGVSYSQEQVNEIVTLANDLKSHLNDVITLANEIKSDYNFATTLMNETKTKVDVMNA